MNHWLTPLLAPKSIAIVGASAREGSLATSTYLQLIDTGYEGTIYFVNPKYEQLFEQPCYDNLSDLPCVPDLVVYAISGLALEESFDQALSLGVGGIVMYANNHIDGETHPTLTERLRHKAKAAGIPVCGGNSMGFYNYDDNVFVSFDRPPPNRPLGHIGLVVHSGSVMTYLSNNDARFCFNYVIASAQETNATIADYIDYLLKQPSTKVIALLIESVRDVEGFATSMENARRQNIPIVITKLGRTAKSAELALSHSGAIAGNHDAFVSLCEKHGAVLTRDIDEMMMTSLLFAAGCRTQTNGVSSILDSGGMREQMIDIADDYGVMFAEISELTKSKIRQHLDSGLPADNPLDAMGALGRNVEETYLECGKALLEDAETGLLTFEFEFRDGFSHYPVLFDVIDQLANYNDKPVIVLNSCAYTDLSETAALLCQKNIPVINGIDVALRAIHNLCSYYSTSIDTTSTPPIEVDQSIVRSWKSRLKNSQLCDEHTSLQLMEDFGLPVVQRELADSLESLMTSAGTLGYPLALKTAEPGIAHKSDSGGVKLNIQTPEELQESYDDVCSRLGNKVISMPMADKGVEIALGMKNDPQFGPLIVLAAGGILIELMNDRTSSLAPVSEAQAITLLNKLRVSKLLQGIRGQPQLDINGCAQLIARFSDMVLVLSDSIEEVDLNPIVVSESRCTIVDALVVPSATSSKKP